MTYNFDPDRWYENERSVIEEERRSGKISAWQYHDAIDDLQRRYDDMMDRLDGTFQIPSNTEKKLEVG